MLQVPVQDPTKASNLVYYNCHAECPCSCIELCSGSLDCTLQFEVIKLLS